MSAKLPRYALTHFDMMRGVAAFAVLVGHVRGLFFQDFDRLAHPSALLKVLYLVTGFGHQSVIVFFALSGFFVGTSVLTARTRWSWTAYLLRRLTRLYVVLIPALLVTAFLDRTGMSLFGEHGIYAGALDAPYLTLDDVHKTGTVGTFLGNFFYLQYVFFRPFGSNGPLWSLSYELWAYILFPLFVQAATRSVTTPRRLGYLVVAAVILWCGGERMVFYTSLWLLGAGVAWGWSRVKLTGLAARIVPIAAAAVFLVALFLARVRFLGHQDRDDAALALATCALLVALLASGGGAADADSPLRKAYHRAAAIVASYSYTLYLVHFPVLVFLHAMTMGPARWQPDAAHLAIGALLCLGVAWLFAYPLARVTEGKTDRVRAWVGRTLRLELPTRTGTEPR